MKKTLILVVSLFFIWFNSFAQYKVLFIGNSYTYVNDLPGMLSDCAQSTGINITHSSSAPGGYTFQNHLNNSTTTSCIQQGGWDYVILQEQSQWPSFPYGQFMNGCYPYARQLCDMIRQYNEKVQIVFYMTWGRKNGDQDNCQNYAPLCTYEGMDSLLYARYMMMAEDNEASVSPVGALWHHIRDHYPNIELYQPDESHPSVIGTYAAACSFYSILFKENPTQITFTPTSIDQNIADIIKNAAKEVVYDSLDKWFFIPSEDTTQHEDTTSIMQYDNFTVSVFPNPAKEKITVSFTEGFTNPSLIKIYSLDGKLLLSQSSKGNNSQVVDLSKISPGTYFLRIEEKKRNLYSQPIIITK